jgi:hypothetical protein
MAMIAVKVELREEGGGALVPGGALILDENKAAPWDLPSTIPLLPGRHKFEASHPTRAILPPNPRVEEVVVPTDPQAPVQAICFEASLVPPREVA